MFVLCDKHLILLGSNNLPFDVGMLNTVTELFYFRIVKFFHFAKCIAQQGSR